MASSDSNDAIVARCIVLISCSANEKAQSKSPKRKKTWEQFHNFRTQFAKDGQKRKLVQRPRLFMCFVAVATCAIAYDDFLAR